MEYDCNGNITRLQRRGLTDNLHGTFGLVDDLYMTYGGNMLTSVCDSASRYSYAGATDFDGVPGQAYPLTYNASGSLVSDAGRGIARIDYDRLNNPVRIQFTNGSVTRYVYSTAGEKLRVIHQTAVPNITVAIGSARELAPSEILSADSTDYLLGGSLTLRNGRIDKYQFEEGYCQAAYSGNASQDNFTFHYYDRDHLGNIRQVIKATGSNKGTVIQTMDYYPFGAEFCDGSTASEVQSRRYNGKELDRMHGLDTYDYGARQYDPVTGRWDRMDPLCEKYYDVSPYAYCGGNPVRYIDPDGRIKIIAVKWDKNEPENSILIQNALRYPEDGTAIHVFSHGTPNSMNSYLYGGKGPISLNNVDEVSDYHLVKVDFKSNDHSLAEKFLTMVNYSVGDDEAQYDLQTDATFVLHVCSAGKDFSSEDENTQSFAAALSKQLPNATILAPNNYLNVMGNMEEKVDDGGKWLQFENGKVTHTYDDDYHPFSTEE